LERELSPDDISACVELRDESLDTKSEVTPSRGDRPVIEKFRKARASS